MASTNITITPNALSTGGNTTITLNTKDTYVLENIDVVVKPQAGSFNNQATSGVTYTENTATATVIPSGGYLYLNKGWFDNTKISLGHLIPDDADYTNAGVAQILSGYEAYDTNGQKLIGTMATVDPKFDGGGLTITPTVEGLVDPKLTVSSSGTFKTATTYGVTETTPSGTDGTNYLTIDGSATVDTKGIVKAKADVTRGAVLYNGAYTGYIDKADNIQALASGSGTKTSAESNIGVTITDGFKPLYIPIVSVKGKGTGGGVSRTGGSASVSMTTNPSVTISKSGKFTEVGTNGTGASYGVTTNLDGEDGTDFLMINISHSATDGTAGGTATINYSRAAVTTSSDIKGAIGDTSGTQVMSATTGSLTQSISGAVSATVSGDGKYFIPIIKSIPVSGGGMTQGTSSVTVSGTAPTVTISNSGKFTEVSSGGVGASYGVTTTTPTTGTDGTDFLKIAIGGKSTEQTFSGSASITVSRAAVVHNGAAAGAIKWANKEVIFGGGNSTFTSDTSTGGSKKITATVNGGGTYYIPIVNLTNKGTGGSVSAGATARIDGIDNPKMDYSISGTVSDDIESFGVLHTPLEGEDGETYYSLIIRPELTSSGNVAGSISGSWSRTAVKSNNTYKGAVSLTTSTQFLAADSGNFDGTAFNSGDIGINFDAVGDEDEKWYFKRAKLSLSGGGLADATLSVTGTAPTVTPDINFLNRTGSTDGTAITLNDYAITTTAPTSGDWVVFGPTGSSDQQTFTGSVTAVRNAVTASVSSGLTKGEDGSLVRATKNYSGTKTFKASVGAGTNRYIPVRTVGASVNSHTITNPSADYSESAKYFVNGTVQSSVPAGIILAQSSNPSDFSRARYIQIIPTAGITNGSSKTTAKGSISAGITKGGNATSGESSKAIGVTSNSIKYCFIKVYDGSYTVA